MLKLEDLDHYINTFRQNISFGDVIYINGPMGSGKTTFISRLVATITAKPVSSPTFGIMHVYPVSESNQIIHMDAYRLKEPEEVLSLGLDFYTEENTLYLIEWAENLPSGFLNPHHIINISFSNQLNSRNITYQNLRG